MQNLMPQLNLPNRTIQQQPKSAQSSKRSEKSGSRDDDFRSLLQEPSKDSASKKPESPSGQEVLEKPVQDIQGRPAKKNDLVDEKVLQDTGMQAFQFMMMGSSQLEDLQIFTGSPGDLVVQQPDVEGVPGSVSVQDQDIDTDLTEMIFPVEEKGTSIPIQDLAQEDIGSDQVKDPGVLETIAADVKTETHAQQPVGEQKNDRRVEKGDGLPKESVSGSQGKMQEEVTPQSVDRKMSDTAQRTQNVQDTPSTQGTENAKEETESDYFATPIYAAEDPFQQNFFQDQFQGRTDAVPTVHIQAANPKELMDHLLDQLKVRASLKEQEFEIQLHPENLGRLAIKVAYTAEKVSISIVCNNEKTMELLSSGAKNIAQIMEENLGAPTTVMVDQEESNYLEQYNNQQNPRQQQQEQEQEKKKTAEDEHQDFLQQLRLGLI